MARTLPDAARSLLHHGRQAHVVVASANGPHVTPELFGWSDGRVWFAVAATTLKAKVLARRPEAGVVVATQGRSLLLSGPVERMDVLDPLPLVAHPGRTLGALRAGVRYGVRNAADLVAFVGDAASGKLGRRLPPRRVLFALDPAAGACVENDVVVEAWGAWEGLDTTVVAHPAPGGVPAVVAVDGAVGLPGRWFPERVQAQVPPGLLGLVERPSMFPLGVVVDDYGAPGPAAKQGTLLRGTGRVTDPAAGVITVVPDRIIDWDGVEVSGRPAWLDDPGRLP